MADDPLKLTELSEHIDAFIDVLIKVSDGAPVPALQDQITLIRTYQTEMSALPRRSAPEQQAETAPPPPVPVPAAPPAPQPEPLAAADARVAITAPEEFEPVDWDDFARQLVEELDLGVAS